VADALERTLTETTDPLTYLALLRRTMALVENDLGDLHRAAELARNAIASGRFDDQLLGETDRLFSEAWRFEELSDLLLNAVSTEPAGSVRLTAVLRRGYYLARDHFSDALQASRTMVELLVDPRHDVVLMLAKVVLPAEYDAARREAEALREFARVRPDDAATPAVRIRAAYLFAMVLNDDDSGAEQLMAALPRLGDDPVLILAAEQVMFVLTRSAEYGPDAVGWLIARAHAFEDRAASLNLLVGLMQLPADAAVTDEARAEISEDAIALADSPEVPASDRAAAHLAVARLKRGMGAVRTAAYHAVQAAEQAADEEVDELLFADALAELGDLGGSSLRGWGGDEVSARALFSNDLTVLLNFGRLCSQAGAWPQAVRAFERAVPLLRATDDAAGLAEVEQQLDAARQQLPQ
jgi:tetratricopeptide (TPR) repeat protein